MKIWRFYTILWIVPFFSFVLGYYLLHLFLQKREIETPNVIGKRLQVGMQMLSKKALSLRLLREQEDSDLPEGLILDQIPRPRQKIRPNQHIFVTISKKPKPILAPDFLGKTHKFITKTSLKKGIRLAVFWLKSFYPVGSCFAQYPQPEQKLENGNMLIYLSAGNESLYVVPDLKDFSVSDFKQILEKENIKIDVYHVSKVGDDHVCRNCKVIDQKPMSGSIVDLKSPLILQVQVE